MGTLLFIVLVVMVLAALLGAGTYSVRRYWSPAGSEVVETTGDSTGAGIAAAVIALLVLILLFFGFTRWNWFGNGNPPSGQPNTPVVTSPAASPSSGSSSSPSSSPAASPS